ncbi:class I SAM-dependent methyltransferase [Desulfocurvus sp.]|jgi:methyltransferase (TIGR00027 family)|uniref:class I SAM-dependent methyltransferase n=1 Tax=Desulfocurvus sp. TaxID=2871698 RepID=UPI0025C22671|nr:class I SAM-dependent methyltransferase [Desulfocurvus sp.]MCK9240213.1 class I SAM-dependent methyltransferase [Desulfocurvus sp.]
MHKTIKVNISDTVADTLFIPLYMRCLETRRTDRIIEDPEACRIVEAVDYDFSKYDQATRSQVGTCIRVRFFDDVTRRFIDANADPVVVNVGCGLDSRAHRVGADKGVFYNVDLPEVMELRDKLLPPDGRNISIHQSMFDTSWMRSIRENHPQARFLVLAEGVFMYFSAQEMRPLIQALASILTPGELAFDACSSFGCRLSSRHDTVKKTNARFRWGLDDNAQLQQWAPNLTLRQVEYYMDKERHRWDFTSRLMALLPPFARAFRMLHYQAAQAAG